MNYYLFVDNDDSGGGDGGDGLDSIKGNASWDPQEDSWMLLMSYQTIKKSACSTAKFDGKFACRTGVFFFFSRFFR